MPTAPIDFEIYASAAQVAATATAMILAAAGRAISARGQFHLVLAGGRTPLAAYAGLVGAAADWGRWHCYFGDERCLPCDDPGRNSTAARRAFLDSVSIPAQNVHTIAVEHGGAAAAAAYQATLAPRLPFDLVLLGMGEDGHTASLFPGRLVPDGPLVIPVADSPKPPLARVTLTPQGLAATRAMLILVTGADKAAALAAWRAGAELPVARVAALRGARVLVDRDAADGAPGPPCPTAAL